MANNQYVNKVVKGSDTLIDLTGDTVTASVLMSGYTAHDRSGAPITGTASGGVEDGHVYQDENGYLVLDDETGKVYETVAKSYTPTESQQSDTITADNGYDAIEQVNVTVGAISSSYVGSGITRRSSSDLSASGATVTAPAGYYASSASKSVASGTEGTPTASKGSVSNHSVTVTPSVTNSAGYISGGTKTGTGVTVSASELVSGTKSISANGTGIDVTDYASIDVAVPSVSPTLITKSITANGTYNASSDNADGYSSVTVSVSSGGGGDMSDPIRFFDYDGTLVASYSSVPASLPSVPAHTELTNGTWNYTLQQITSQFNAEGTCDVGANYDTVSGATEIDAVMQNGRLHPYLSIAVKGTVSVDWGDNTTPDTVTGTSLTSRITDVHHEYAVAGKYTIKISRVSGDGYALVGSATRMLLNKDSSSADENLVYGNCVKHARIGRYCTIGARAFYSCYSLLSVSIPGDIGSVGAYAFYYSYALHHVNIPSGVTEISNYTFAFCNALARVSLPFELANIGGYAFYYDSSLLSLSIPSNVETLGHQVFFECNALSHINFPDGITSTGTNVFQYCRSLSSHITTNGLSGIGSSTFRFCYGLISVEISANVESIGAYAFNSCYGLKELHLKRAESVTSLGNVNALTEVSSDITIYVPASKLNDYKTAENWSTYADYIVGE